MLRNGSIRSAIQRVRNSLLKAANECCSLPISHREKPEHKGGGRDESTLKRQKPRSLTWATGVSNRLLGG